MFDWLKHNDPPVICKANPGKGIKVSVAFTNGARTWSEDIEVIPSLAAVLKSGGYPPSVRKSWIELDSGLIIQPQIVSIRPIQKGVQTVTTIEVSHPDKIPAGVFEFQHAAGDSAQQSIAKGFENWMQIDLPVFMDALQQKAQHCMLLQFDLPAEGSAPPRKRRVVLGPVSHLVKPQPTGASDPHPFCPCCLFTNTAAVMKPKVSDTFFYGIRLFAMRNPDRVAEADCRLNGEDWAPGKQALIEYVKSWPDRGVEFRKQYVVVQNQPD
jgi:hypothetical protein